MKTKSTRTFGGLLTYEEIKEAITKRYPKATEEELPPLIRRESNFQKKHLRAYLRGQERFTFGRDITNRPIYYKVMIKEE